MLREQGFCDQFESSLWQVCNMENYEGDFLSSAVISCVQVKNTEVELFLVSIALCQ